MTDRHGSRPALAVRAPPAASRASHQFTAFQRACLDRNPPRHLAPKPDCQRPSPRAEYFDWTGYKTRYTAADPRNDESRKPFWIHGLLSAPCWSRTNDLLIKSQWAELRKYLQNLGIWRTEKRLVPSVVPRDFAGCRCLPVTHRGSTIVAARRVRNRPTQCVSRRSVHGTEKLGMIGSEGDLSFEGRRSGPD